MNCVPCWRILKTTQDVTLLKHRSRIVELADYELLEVVEDGNVGLLVASGAITAFQGHCIVKTLAVNSDNSNNGNKNKQKPSCAKTKKDECQTSEEEEEENVDDNSDEED
eukprot:260923_1